MKVLLTNPPWIFKQYGLWGWRIGVRAGSRWPFSVRGKALGYIPYPGFMGYATTYLQSQGVEAIFYDAVAWQHSYEEFFRRVDGYKPDIVIQEISTPSFAIDCDIARKLHARGYEVCFVGPHATAYAEELSRLPYVDYILKGAYEYPALTMCKERRKGIYDHAIAALDDLPYPWRDTDIIGQYRDYNCLKALMFPQLWVYASRGCVFQCDFCLWPHTMFERQCSLRAPEKVIAEIEDAVGRFGFKHIYFDDDTWNIGGEDRLRQLSDGLKRIGLPWSINARLDLSSKEMFRYFVESGCVGLRVGVESLSQRLLDTMHKGLTVDAIIDTIKFLETLDADIYLLFMHYLSGEQESDRIEQNRMIKKFGLRCQNPPCIPFPGTPYFKKLKEAGFGDSKPEEYDGGNIGVKLLKRIRAYSSKTHIS